jgi:hypothetical protein
MEFIYRNPKLYFIGGKAQHGKSTIGKIIKEEYEKRGKKVAILQHMKYLKGYFKDYLGWDGREETKPRTLLQEVGTGLIREKLNKKYFYINRITEDIEILSYFFDVLVVDDVRLDIEIEKQREVFDNLIAIKVVRPNVETGLTDKEKKHVTETGLDNYDRFDYVVVNDGGLEDLKAKIIDIINEVEEERK